MQRANNFISAKKIPYANEVENVCACSNQKKIVFDEKLFHNSHWSSFMNEVSCNE